MRQINYGRKPMRRDARIRDRWMYVPTGKEANKFNAWGKLHHSQAPDPFAGMEQFGSTNTGVIISSFRRLQRQHAAKQPPLTIRLQTIVDRQEAERSRLGDLAGNRTLQLSRLLADPADRWWSD